MVDTKPNRYITLPIKVREVHSTCIEVILGKPAGIRALGISYRDAMANALREWADQLETRETQERIANQTSPDGRPIGTSQIVGDGVQSEQLRNIYQGGRE